MRAGVTPELNNLGRSPGHVHCLECRGMSVHDQVVSLFLLALPVACIAWTVTHEEVFREPREWCAARSHDCRALPARKLFYLFTCEYCFSHYVTALVLVITRYRLLYDGWRGYFVGGFALVWIANVYMTAFSRLRLDIREERAEIAVKEAGVDAIRGPTASG